MNAPIKDDINSIIAESVACAGAASVSMAVAASKALKHFLFMISPVAKLVKSVFFIILSPVMNLVIRS